jgi:hypothetical protein
MKTLSAILAVLMIITPAYAQYASGTGEPNDPFLIYTAEQMNAIGAEPSDWDSHFKLMADIDLSGFADADFNIIGGWQSWSFNRPFRGVFDGNGHAISNFSYTSVNADCTGLFGYVFGQGEESTIKGLRLIDPNVDAGAGSCVGSLVGWLRNGTVTACSAEGGIVSGDKNVGGLVGAHGFTAEPPIPSPPPLPVPPPYTISNCYSTTVVVGHAYVGGLVGSNGGLVTQCYTAGTVKGDSQVGGLAGKNYRCDNGFCFSGSVIDSCSTGTVTGDEYVGGLVGDGVPEEVINSFWDTETSGQQTSDGGTGKTTAELQTAGTFLAAGWDFVDETEDGTEGIWWILEGQSYPRLRWQYGLAFSHYPQNRPIDIFEDIIQPVRIIQPITLRWLPGGSGLYHDVYFGDDEEAVSDATTESPGIYRGRQQAEMTTYDPGTLELDKTYYWRIDEVDVLDPDGLWKGNIWSFTTANFIVIDDFESYTDEEGNHIWETWIDGLGCQTCEPSIPGNGTTSLVGHQWYGWLETPVHGGKQSMVLAYDNASPPCYGEIERTWGEPQNWKIQGADTLELFFRYGTGVKDGDRLYVAIEDFDGRIAVVAHPGADALAIRNWQRWDISLADLAAANVDVAAVKKMYIGVGDRDEPQPGGTGMICIDNIRGTRTSSPVEFDFIVVDDFESYNDIDPPDPESHRIFDTWIDGWLDPNNGSVVGYAYNFAEQTIAHSGWLSMPFSYDNSGLAHYSEATTQIADLEVGQDWTAEGVSLLSMWFRGKSDNAPEPMYVALANADGPSVVVHHDDPHAVLIDAWVEWTMDLQEFADQGVKLTDISTISIGFGDKNGPRTGGTGKMWFDDVRLYPPR